MSENNEGRRPEGENGVPPEQSGVSPEQAAGEHGWNAQPANPDYQQADYQQTAQWQGQQTGPFGYQQPGAWSAQETNAFQPGYAADGKTYPQGGYVQGGYPPQYGQPAYGQEGYGQQYGQQYGQPAYGQGAYPQDGAPGGYPPSYGGYENGGGYPPYGGGYGQPPSKGKGPLIAWIVLGVILLIAIVVGILFATGVLSSSDEQEPSSTTVEQSVEPSDESDDPVPAPGEPARYGDSAELDALWDSCEAGSLADCDELYYVSGFDTEYEEFGNTCGGTTDAAYGTCSSVSDESALSYGDDADLDVLWDSCEAGNFADCDELWWSSPIGSEYETFAESCGGRTEGAAGTCEMRSESGDF
ncbi:flagellar basal body-associated FliL family protein [Flaviflexus equikiangi]|uniref:Uncharacterized protein n=1 Tax=Flaviflexus equikiangi TaxID=2758573 RepID=A0ABS2TKG9_9ACTO|nr:hypothetical protein [Flaviflexus equikiangi]MBM9434036.1 hypothetical protein [Flaviflexus equikiangi]